MYEDFQKIAQEMPLNEYGIKACKAIEDLVDTLLRRDRFIRKLEDKLFEYEGNKKPKGAKCGNCRKFCLLECPVVCIEKKAGIFIARDADWFCADYEAKGE